MSGRPRFDPLVVGGRNFGDALNLITHILCVVVLLAVLYLLCFVKAGYDRAIKGLQSQVGVLEERVEALETTAVPPSN